MDQFKKRPSNMSAVSVLSSQQAALLARKSHSSMQTSMMGATQTHDRRGSAPSLAPSFCQERADEAAAGADVLLRRKRQQIQEYEHMLQMREKIMSSELALRE